jgi:pimeloyl-ACP methyl ester carboxylesterase
VIFTPSHRGGSGSPLVLLHGFTDTWRTWELVLPMLERRHDVLAPTLAGHAGGPPLGGEVTDSSLVDELEEAMDAAGLQRAHIAGNSLGGYLALRLAERGRAVTVVAIAPAGGWAPGDESYRDALGYFAQMRPLVKQAAPHAAAIMATPEGRRNATAYITVEFEHIPPDLLAHQLAGAASCAAAEPLIDYALRQGWPLDAERIDCPVRMVWGSEDRLLPLPAAAAGYRAALPQADWVELDGVGHCPQLDVPAVTADLILSFTY